MTFDNYEANCEQRLEDMIYYLRQVYPGQTITGDRIMHNASLWKISRSAVGTQRVIDWCRREIAKRVK